VPAWRLLTTTMSSKPSPLKSAVPTGFGQEAAVAALVVERGQTVGSTVGGDDVGSVLVVEVADRDAVRSLAAGEEVAGRIECAVAVSCQDEHTAEVDVDHRNILVVIAVEISGGHPAQQAPHLAIDRRFEAAVGRPKENRDLVGDRITDHRVGETVVVEVGLGGKLGAARHRARRAGNQRNLGQTDAAQR
jgi:hypothetical protein